MAIKINKPIPITVKEHFKYDQKYYNDFSGGITYDVNRPIRRVSHKRISLLPSDASMISFAFGNGTQMIRHSRLFKTVYGYEINLASIDDARKHGFSDKVMLKDVTEHLFRPAFPKSTMASCYYLFEHLQAGIFEKLIQGKENLDVLISLKFVIS